MGLHHQRKSYRIAIPKTVDGNGIAEAMYVELENLGHRPEFFPLAAPDIAQETDVVILFGPFGRFLHVFDQFKDLPAGHRPAFVFWNTEGLPDLRIPSPVTGAVSLARSWFDRLSTARDSRWRKFFGKPPFSTLEPRLLRFRYLGDYLYARQQGWVDVFADISAIYAAYLRKLGLPAIVAPFGSAPILDWYSDLDLERDIDVLWMGKRATKRRSLHLDRVREELRAHGVEMAVFDNVERPFVYDQERTEILNRAKITLNLLRTWYDENSLRISLAAPNRSLIVSEPLLPHVPEYRAGIHYVSAPIERLTETILYYLKHEQERQQIVENAYQLTTELLTMNRSMQILMDAVSKVRAETPGLSYFIPDQTLAQAYEVEK